MPVILVVWEAEAGGCFKGKRGQLRGDLVSKLKVKRGLGLPLSGQCLPGEQGVHTGYP